MSSKDVLGRGLKSLIPEEIKGSIRSGEKVLILSLESIKIGEHQPRRIFDSEKISELAQSIKECGIIQPLIVSQKKDGSYYLIAGHRRLLAAKEAGLSEVPVIVKKTEPLDDLEMSLIENIQRENLNPLEEAEAYKLLASKFNLRPKEIGQRVGKSESTIKNSLRLLDLPQEIKDALEKNVITYGHARAIITLPKEEQLNILSEIVKRKLTVREVELRVRRIHEIKKQPSEKEKDDFDIYLENISGQLRDIFQSKVVIERKGKGGRILIDFYSKEELERILELIQRIKKYTAEEE